MGDFFLAMFCGIHDFLIRKFGSRESKIRLAYREAKRDAFYRALDEMDREINKIIFSPFPGSDFNFQRELNHCFQRRLEKYKIN